LQTPIPHEKLSKRQREEGSSSTTRSEAKEFRICYRKRTKLTPRVELDKEIEEKVVIIITNSPYATSKFTTSPIGRSSTKGHKETELESQNVQTEKQKTVFDRYKETKLSNEILKIVHITNSGSRLPSHIVGCCQSLTQNMAKCK